MSEPENTQAATKHDHTVLQWGATLEPGDLINIEHHAQGTVGTVTVTRAVGKGVYEATGLRRDGPLGAIVKLRWGGNKAARQSNNMVLVKQRAGSSRWVKLEYSDWMWGRYVRRPLAVPDQ